MTTAAARADLHGDLQQLAHKHIYFGHQSVGANILDGVKTLAAQAGVPVPINEVPSASAIRSGGFSHVFVAENGDPHRKLASFKAALGEGAPVDLALVKFCYVDITADTDVRGLFDAYRDTIEELRRKNPRTVFVHVTLPLTTAQTGPKAFVKWLLGRAPSGTIENVQREEYNQLLRREYAGREPLFDLARIESVSPNGTQTTVEWHGKVVPAMYPGYTDDGGHLNAEGRRIAARHLIALLARVSSPLQKFEDSATPVRLRR